MEDDAFPGGAGQPLKPVLLDLQIPLKLPDDYMDADPGQNLLVLHQLGEIDAAGPGPRPGRCGFHSPLRGESASRRGRCRRRRPRPGSEDCHRGVFSGVKARHGSSRPFHEGFSARLQSIFRYLQAKCSGHGPHPPDKGVQVGRFGLREGV